MSEKSPSLTSEAKAYRANLKQTRKEDLLSSIDDLVDGRFANVQVTKNNRLQYRAGVKETDSDGEEYNLGGKFVKQNELEDIAAFEDQIRLGMKAKEIASVTPEIDAALNYAREQDATLNETQKATSPLKEVAVMRHALVKSNAISALEVGNMSDEEIRTLVDYMHSENTPVRAADTTNEPNLIPQQDSAANSPAANTRPELTPIDTPASPAVIVGKLAGQGNTVPSATATNTQENTRGITPENVLTTIKNIPAYFAARITEAAFYRRNNRNSNAPERNRSRKILLGAVGALGVGLVGYLALRGHDTSSVQDLTTGNSFDTPLQDVAVPSAGGGNNGGSYDGINSSVQAVDNANIFGDEALTISRGEGWIHQLHDMGISNDAIPGILKKLSNSQNPSIREWVYIMKDGNPGIAKTGQITANVLQSIEKLR